MDGIWSVISVVFLSGCIGGLITGLFFKPENRKQLLLWYPGELCGVQHPGLLGNILLGGVAAVIFWSLYGPFSGALIIGSGGAMKEVGLTVGQLAGCLLIGMGGAGYLFTEARRRCLKEQIIEPSN